MLERLLLDIDIPTLAASRGLMQLTLAGLIIWMGTRQDESRGAHWWAAGLALNGLALLAFIIDAPEVAHISTSVNHMSFGLSSACILYGFWLFGMRPVQPWLLALILAIPAISLLLWEWLYPNARFRILTTASGQVVYLIALARCLSFPPRREMASTYRVLQGIVLAYTLLMIWSYAGVTQLLPSTARVTPDYHSAIFSVGSMLFMLALAFAFLALQFTQLASRNADLARRDWLTGLLNRRGFFEAAAPFDNWNSESGHGAALMAIDVDHFKEINDRHGHAAGDTNLRALADLLSRSARGNDVVARVGGEEFVILMPRMDLQTAESRARAIVRACRAMRIEVGEHTVSFTISLGVAGQLPGESIEGLMSRADTALYEAKRRGRDRTASALVPGA